MYKCIHWLENSLRMLYTSWILASYNNNQSFVLQWAFSFFYVTSTQFFSKDLLHTLITLLFITVFRANSRKQVPFLKKSALFNTRHKKNLGNAYHHTFTRKKIGTHITSSSQQPHSSCEKCYSHPFPSHHQSKSEDTREDDPCCLVFLLPSSKKTCSTSCAWREDNM